MTPTPGAPAQDDEARRAAEAESARQAEREQSTAAADRAAAAADREDAAVDREAAGLILQEAADLQAAGDARRPTASPSSVQLEPFVVPRPALADTVVQERVSVRSSGYDVPPALDPTAPLFPATRRVLAGGQVVPATPREQQDGERREIRLTARALHDGALYEAGAPVEVTRAQFLALRAADAADGVWPAD